MSKSDLQTARKASGRAPEAYYYLSRYIEDCNRIRNQHFQNREEMEKKLLHLEAAYFGSLEKDGMLQNDINLHYNNILLDLKADYPRLTRRNILLFCYASARVPVELICKWAGISSTGAASAMKNYITSVIGSHACPRKEEYLALLSR